MAAVQQLHQQHKRAPGFKIAVDQRVPAAAFFPAGFGIAIAGQVYKPRCVHPVKIDGGRFSRRGAYTRKAFAHAQFVDE